MFLQEFPIWLTHLISIFLGLIVGSFLNVVILRLPKKLSVVYPASRCPQCDQAIRWYDNLPVVSYLFLRGKCRFCQNKISIQYPIIEILTAVLFLAMRIRFGWGPSLFLRDWPFASLLVAIAFIDLEHRIIPDVLSLGGLVFGLLTCLLATDLSWMQCFLGALFGFSAFYLLAWTYQRLTGRSGLGGGDIKLLAMLGAFVGPAGVFATIFISSILGSLVGLGWALVARNNNVMKFSIPFGPFLVIGALYYYLLGDILWFQFMIPM